MRWLLAFANDADDDNLCAVVPSEAHSEVGFLQAKQCSIELQHGREAMRFPTLTWAIDEKRLAHYELAAGVGIDASRFSRCLRGHFEFAPHERVRIAEVLGYQQEWLFARPAPAARANSNRPELTLATVACAPRGAP